MANRHQAADQPADQSASVSSGRCLALAAVLLAATLGLAGCGGGGGGGSTDAGSTPGTGAGGTGTGGGRTPTVITVPDPAALTLAALSSVAPAAGATGVARDVTPVITLVVRNATSSDGAKLALVCNTRAIPFTSASVLSSDAKSITVKLTPQAGAILAGDACTLSGNVSTNGTTGAVNTTIGSSFSVFLESAVKKLALAHGCGRSSARARASRGVAFACTPRVARAALFLEAISRCSRPWPRPASS